MTTWLSPSVMQIWKQKSVSSASTWSCGLWGVCPHSSCRPFAQRAGIRKLEHCWWEAGTSSWPQCCSSLWSQRVHYSSQGPEATLLKWGKLLPLTPAPNSLDNPKEIHLWAPNGSDILREINSLFMLILQRRHCRPSSLNNMPLSYHKLTVSWNPNSHSWFSWAFSHKL